MILNPYAIVIDAYATLVGKKPGASSYADHKAFINTNGQAAYLTALDSIFANVSNESLGSTVLTNLGLTSVFTTAQAEAYFASNAGNRVKAALDLASLLANYSGSDTAVLAAKTAYNNTTADAYAYASNSANLTDAVTSGVAANTGQSFNLTTNVDNISGGAADDTIAGLIGGSGTYTVGDNINGGSGNDVLNLIDAGSATAAPLTSLSGVETVNVRMLSAGTTIINANDWDGVTTLSNASSLAGSTLNVTGADTSMGIKVHGDSDVNVAFNNTTTASSVSLTLVSVGTGNTASTIGSASAAATANIDLDLNNSGLLAGVAVDVQGSLNLARLEAGSNVTSYTLTGDGNAALVTDDTITSFNASAAAGNIDITFSGASEVAAVGGAGNDTFRFGTTISNNDSVDGGAGDDTVTLSLGGFNRTLSTTNVETATLTFNDDAGGTVNGTGGSVSTFNLLAGSAGADAIVAGVKDGATINLTTNANNLDDVTVGFASGSDAGTLNFGTATGGVAIDVLTVTGAAAVSLNAIAGSAGAAVAVTTAAFAGTTLTVNASGGESDISITNLTANALQSLTLLSNGSAGVTLTSGLEANTALQSVTVLAQGSDAADVVLGSLNNSGSALGFNSLTLTGTTGADITLGTVTMGNGATAAANGTITMVAANGSDVGTTAMDVTTTGAFTLNLNIDAQASGDVSVGDVVMRAGTAASAASAAIVLNVGATTVGAAGSVRVEKVLFDTAGAQLNVGAVNVGTSAGFTLGASGIIASADLANIDVGDMSINVAADGSATLGTILTTAGAIGALELTVADSASAAVGAIVASAMGAITLGAVGDGEIDLSQITLTSNMESITITLSDEADVTIANFTAGGDVGAITIGGAASATANFGNINASSVGTITVSGAGFVDFGTISAASIGAIDVSQMTSGTFNINLSAVTNAAEVALGQATNTVISGVGNDVITLTSGTDANDNIQYGTGTQGTDNIIGFEAGASGDQIEFATGFAGASGGIVLGSALATDASTVAVATASTASGAITISGTVAVVLVNATAFASTAAFVSAVASGGSLEINASAAATAGSLAVVWTDGADSYVSLLGVTAAASGTNAMIENGSAMVTVAQLQGVTPGALVAANFDFV